MKTEAKMKILDKKNKEITDIKTWKDAFFKSYPKLWKKHRSAMSTSEYWLDKNRVNSLEKKLQKVFPALSIDVAYPECPLKFDSFSNPRENDILALDEHHKYLISVEAKTDEEFGDYVFLEAMRNAILEKRKNPSSKQIERLLGLYKNYFCGDDEILNLMHQLTYWYAGSIAEAKRRKYPNVVLLNQVFIYPELNKEKLEKNHKDFEDFVNLISKKTIKKVACNKIYGPIHNEYTQGLNIYILKQTISE